MKTIINLVLAILLMASCTGQNQSESINQSQKSEVMEKVTKENIEKLLVTYKTSLNTSDAALAQSLYTNDGIFMPSGAPSAIGSDNILKSYEYIFSQIQLTIEFYIEEIVVEGDLAFATTSSKGTTLINATGDTVPEANRELFVLEKVDEEWKIARYMFNKTE